MIPSRTHLLPVVEDDDLAVLVVHRHRALVALACRNTSSSVNTGLQLHAKQPKITRNNFRTNILCAKKRVWPFIITFLKSVQASV